MAKPLAKITSEMKDERVLLLAPTGRDALLTQKIFAGAGIASFVCKDMNEFCLEMENGAGAALLTEEALNLQAIHWLTKCLEKQPAWSDIPVILFAINSDSAGVLLNLLGERVNIIVLERPINIAVVTGAMRSALRARRRQYQTKTLLLELEEADRQKDLFLATISHELRTPLNAILGWAEILCTGNLDEETTRRALQAIERNAKSQSQLIGDILDMSRIIRGSLRLNPEPLNIIATIQAAIDVVRPSAQAKKISMEAHLGADVPVISGDAGRLQQVIWNLLSNAIKFTAEGGRVEIRLTRNDDHLKIIVSDTGKGISADFLPHVFDYFRQADNTITRTYGGLGLGLAIVRHLVELHGGRVQAASPGLDKGATFTVQLPLMTVPHSYNSPILQSRLPETPNKSQLTFDSHASLQGLHILVIDDAADTREVMTEILGQCKANVVTATSATEALDLFERQHFDLLISDIEMPHRDGYSLMEEIRAKEAASGRRIPAIALTAHTRPIDRVRALSAGYDTHIAKPIEMTELLTLVAGLTRSVQSVRELDCATEPVAQSPADCRPDRAHKNDSTQLQVNHQG
jgi:signal transduction histidine kinase/DNA-binding NarL/FixJ family response regulator